MHFVTKCVWHAYTDLCLQACTLLLLLLLGNTSNAVNQPDESLLCMLVAVHNRSCSRHSQQVHNAQGVLLYVQGLCSC